MKKAAAILRSINPVTLWFGPIFHKEVRTAGRRRSTYVLRGLYSLGLLLVAVIAFLYFTDTFASGSAVSRLQSLQQLAPMLTIVISAVQLGVLMLAAPILAAGSICDERRARSLDVLLTTPMTAGEVVWGKLVSRIVQMVILALMATPVLLAVRIFGGLNAEVVLASVSLSISSAILGAALAVLFSVRQRRAPIAALFAILSLLLIQCGPSMVEGVRYQLMNEYVISSPFRSNILATCSPAVLDGISNTVPTGESLPRLILFAPVAQPPRAVIGGFPAALVATTGRAPIDLGPMWVISTAYNLLCALGVAVYTTMVLRRAMSRSGRGALLLAESAPPAAVPEAAPAETPTPEAKPPEVEAAAAPVEKFRSKDRTVSDNPVLWREVRQPIFGARWVFRTVVILSIAALLFLYFKVGLANNGLHLSLALIGAAAVMIQAVFMTSGAYAGEREARTWEVLLTSTLTARQILWGKFIGTMRSFWFIPALVIAHFSVAAAFGYVRPQTVLFLALIYSGPLLLLTATGQLFSLRFRKAVTAGALNLTVAALLWVFIWPSLLLIPWILRTIDDLLVHRTLADDILDNHFESIVNGVLCLNPVAATYLFIEPALYELGSKGVVKLPYKVELLLDQKLNLNQATLAIAGIAAIYFLGAAITMTTARLKFRSLSGRSS